MDSCLNWPSICSADLLSRSPKWTGITGAIPIERKGVSVVFACILSIFIFEWIEILETFNCPECFDTKHSDYKSSGDWTFPAELTNLKFHRFPGAKFCIIFAFRWCNYEKISIFTYFSHSLTRTDFNLELWVGSKVSTDCEVVHDFWVIFVGINFYVRPRKKFIDCTVSLILY